MACRVNPIKYFLNGLEHSAKFASERMRRDAETLKEIGDKFGRTKLGTHIAQTFYPEKKSEIAQEAASRIVMHRARNNTFNNQFANEFYRLLKFQNEYKNGDKTRRRDEYLNKYTPSRRAEMLMLSEEGKLTGDKIYDRMASINRYIYKKLVDLDVKEGISYDERSNYIKHVLDRSSEDAFNDYLARNFKFANPGYMSPREFETYRKALAVRDPATGKPMFKLRTTSPERLLQIRIAEFSSARSKIDTLKDLQSKGLAWLVTAPAGPGPAPAKIPPAIERAWGKNKIHTADGRNYIVHPDAFQVIDNAYRLPVESIMGDVRDLMKGLKSVTAPLKLGLSLAHFDHLSRVRFGDRMVNFAYKQSAGGKLSGGDILHGFADWAAHGVGLGGYPGMVWDAVKYGGIIRVLKGDRNARSPDEAWAVKQLNDSGFKANISDESAVEFTDWMASHMPAWAKGIESALGKGSRLGAFAYKIATIQPVQRYLFGQVIPSVKAASLLEKIDTIYRINPDLELPQNESERLQKIQAAEKQVDLRFGEMNWDNIFWTKAWKDVAIGTLLSASWQMGLIDYSAGALKDLSAIPLHMDERIRELRSGKGGEAFRNTLSDRAMFAGFYTMHTMIRGAVISYVLGGGVKQWMDYFYPRIGTNPDGSVKRLRQLDFAPEMLSWWEHSKDVGDGSVDLLSGIGGAGVMLKNKMAPWLNAATESVTNTTFYGGKITDKPWTTAEGLYERVNHFIGQALLPFSIQSATSAKTQPGQQNALASALDPSKYTGGDAAMSFFGLNQAPHWTQRTELENNIIRIAHEELPQYKISPQVFSAMQHYQDAIRRGDHGEAAEAHQSLLRLGKTEKQIQAIGKAAHIPVAVKLFKLLKSYPEKQAELYQSMSPEEKKLYGPELSKKAHLFLKPKPVTPYEQWSRSLPGGGYRTGILND